jgi:hypothetical protein
VLRPAAEEACARGPKRLRPGTQRAQILGAGTDARPGTESRPRHETKQRAQPSARKTIPGRAQNMDRRSRHAKPDLAAEKSSGNHEQNRGTERNEKSGHEQRSREKRTGSYDRK